MTSQTAERINWTNTLFLTLCPLVAILGTVWLFMYSSISWKTWALFTAFLFLTGLAITAGYHRLFSHKTYRSNAVMRFLYLFFGAATFEGSVLNWCTDHRRHHRYEDTEKDPYNINRGFWFAHMGWLIRLDDAKRDYSNVHDLKADPLCALQHRFYAIIAVLTGFALPTLIAWSWGEALGGFIVAGALRISLNQHFTFLINSLCHTLGKQPYTREKTARDHWVTAIFTYGEGYHNFHHKFPLDYRNGIKYYHYDPAKWLIWALEKCGWATEVKRIPARRIAQHVLQAQDVSEHDRLAQAKERLLQVIQRLETLDKDYREALKTVSCKLALKEQRQKLKQTQQELKAGMAAWAKLIAKETTATV